jgi:hypothetical protein
LGYNVFVPCERSDEAATGLTFGLRIEGAAPKKWQSSSGQVAIEWRKISDLRGNGFVAKPEVCAPLSALVAARAYRRARRL